MHSENKKIVKNNKFDKVKKKKITDNLPISAN